MEKWDFSLAVLFHKLRKQFVKQFLVCEEGGGEQSSTVHDISLTSQMWMLRKLNENEFLADLFDFIFCNNYLIAFFN